MKISIYTRKYNLLKKNMLDIRLVFVFAPILIAASWALYNIGRVALQQLARIRS